MIQDEYFQNCKQSQTKGSLEKEWSISFNIYSCGQEVIMANA